MLDNISWYQCISRWDQTICWQRIKTRVSVFTSQPTIDKVEIVLLSISSQSVESVIHQLSHQNSLHHLLQKVLRPQIYREHDYTLEKSFWQSNSRKSYSDLLLKRSGPALILIQHYNICVTSNDNMWHHHMDRVCFSKIMLDQATLL